MTLSATILPSEAEQKISYASNNTGIATVSSTGEIKGIAPETVHIILTAGGYTRTVELTVKVKTEAIELNQTYVVLKPGEAVQMTASVVPKKRQPVCFVAFVRQGDCGNFGRRKNYSKKDGKYDNHRIK